MDTKRLVSTNAANRPRDAGDDCRGHPVSEKRQYVRTSFPAGIRLTHPSFGTVSVKSRDMSNGGVYVYTAGQVTLPEGSEVIVQAEDIEDAPEVRATVVRVEDGGLALMFELPE
jgi:hypothetical protein